MIATHDAITSARRRATTNETTPSTIAKMLTAKGSQGTRISNSVPAGSSWTPKSRKIDSNVGIRRHAKSPANKANGSANAMHTALAKGT